MLVNIPTLSNGTAADANQINDRFAIVANALNGNIETVNLKDNAVTTAKVANRNITSAKIGLSEVKAENIGNDYIFGASLTSNITMAASTWVQFKPQTKNYDPSNMFDVSTGKFTAQADGVYEFGAVINYENGTLPARAIIEFRRAGSVAQEYRVNDIDSASFRRSSGQIQLYLLQGDTIEVWAWRNTAGAMVNAASILYGSLVSRITV